MLLHVKMHIYYAEYYLLSICNNAMLRLTIVVVHNYLIGMQYGLYNIAADKVVGFIFCTNFCVCIYDTFDRFAGVCC